MISAWTNQAHPKDGDDPGDEHTAIYGGNLIVNGQTCASSTDLWYAYPLTCTLPTSQPVPEFDGAAIFVPLVVALLISSVAVIRKSGRIGDE